MRSGSALISKFFRKPFAEKRLLIEALLLTALTRFIIVSMPFKVLGRLIGKAHPVPENMMFEGYKMICSSGVHQASPQETQSEIRNSVRSVAKAVQSVSKQVPWQATCLVQAATGKIMLNRRNLPASLFLGVNKHDLKNMEPHAWLTSDSTVILGGGELEKYTVVSTFT